MNTLVAPELDVAVAGGVKLHLEDQETHLDRYLPSGLTYLDRSRCSERPRNSGADSSIVGFVIDVLIPREQSSQGEHSSGQQKSIAFIRKVRQLRPQVPLVVLTNHPGDRDLASLVRSGVLSREDVFSKLEYDPPALVERLLRPLPEPPQWESAPAIHPRSDLEEDRCPGKEGMAAEGNGLDPGGRGRLPRGGRRPRSLEPAS